MKSTKRPWYNLHIIESNEWVFSTRDKFYAYELLGKWTDCYMIID